ncbi:sensor domain-containing protein [Mycolicibacter minnesotensis]
MPKGQARKASVWRVGAVSAVAVALVVVVAALVFRLWDNGQPDTRPVVSASLPAAEVLTTSVAASPPPAPPPPPPGFPHSAIDTVLLAPAEITTLVGGSSEPLMQVEQTTHGMLNNQNLVAPPTCVGMIFTGERAVFADTGYTAMKTQQLQQLADSDYYNTVGPRQVAQTVVIYDTAEQAQSILAVSQRQWQACAGSEVRLGTVGQNGENNLHFEVGQVQVGNHRLAVLMVANSQVSEGSACEQVLAIRANVVVGVRACRYPEPPPGYYIAEISSVRSDTAPLASAMIDKITA